MGNVLSVQLHDFLFDRLRYDSAIMDDTELSILATLVTTDVTLKADKVTGATAGHFASLVLDNATGKYNIADSGFDETTFAPLTHKHSQYLDKTADQIYPSKTYVLLFDNDATHAAFTVTDPTVIVTNFNADLLDGSHASAFAAKVHTHSIYIPNNANSSYNSVSYQITFSNDATHPPFTISDGTLMINNLNAHYLGGIASAGYALKNHTHTNYIPNDTNYSYPSSTYQITFNNDASHKPFTIADKTVVVSNLNAEYLNGHADTYFVVAGVWTAFDARYYTQTAADALLALKMNIHQGSTYAAGMVPKYNGTDNNVISSGVAITDLATLTNVLAKVDEVTGATAGNFAKLKLNGTTGKYTIEDSGKSNSDYAPIVHDHDSRYFTQTQLTDYSTVLGLAAGSLIESTSYYIVGSSGSFVGGSPATNGYTTLRINGATIKVMTTA